MMKPAGKLTLVTKTDKRPELNTAASSAADFEDADIRGPIDINPLTDPEAWKIANKK